MVQGTAESSISAYLGSPLTLGEPVKSGPLAVYPVFGPDPKQTYISLKEAIGKGLTVKELPGGGSVRDLVIQNPSRHNVLVFEGEEVLGAQQNRTFDISVLVPAGSQLTVPVSCVEAGRWDGSRNAEAFEASPQAAHPKLRGEKVKHSLRARMAGLETRADQSEVWREVGERSAIIGSQSRTGSLHDAYETRRGQLNRITSPIKPTRDQIGVIAVIGGKVTALDLVSRPDVFADLHPAILQGYALDAIVAQDTTREVTPEEVQSFVATAVETRILEGDGIGLGRDFRFESPTLVGAGLISGEELIQLSVFPSNPDEDESGRRPRGSVFAQTRIQRPSRRLDR
jgi:hypothetical protein